MFSTIFHELRNHLEFHLSCRNSGIQDPPIFFSFFFFLQRNLHISTFPWILRFTSGLKLTMLPPLLPLYFTILFSPREVCHALIDFQQTAIEPVSFRGYPFRIWSYLSIECCIDVVQCGLFSFFFFRLSYQRYRIEITSQDGLLKDGLRRWIRFKDLLKLYNDAIKVRKRNNGKYEFKKKYNKKNKFNNLLAK